MPALEFRALGLDEKPSPKFREILHSIGRYVAFGDAGDSSGRVSITPARLKNFYKSLGSYPEIQTFYEQPHKHISTVYTLLKIPHSLEQLDGHHNQKPSVPTLDLKGFVEWMMHRLHLDPDETAPMIMKAFRIGLIRDLESSISTIFKKGIPREFLPKVPLAILLEETRKRGLVTWKAMSNQSHVRKLRRNTRHGRKQENERTNARYLQPSVQSVSDDGSDSDSAPIRNKLDKSDFNFNLGVPVLNLSTHNTDNETSNGYRPWTHSNGTTGSSDSDFDTRPREVSDSVRSDSPPPSYTDASSVNSFSMPRRSFELLSTERRTPFSTPSSSRSPAMRALDHGHRLHSTERGRGEVREGWNFRGFGGGGSGSRRRGRTPGHSGYGNDDSDAS